MCGTYPDRHCTTGLNCTTGISRSRSDLRQPLRSKYSDGNSRWGAWTVTVESVERGLWVTPCLFPSLPDSARLQQSVLWWTRLCLLRQDWRKCDGSDALNTGRPSCPKGSSLCFGDADWTHWGYCSATCGVGQVTRSQTLSRSLAVCSLSADTTSFAGMSS